MSLAHTPRSRWLAAAIASPFGFGCLCCGGQPTTCPEGMRVVADSCVASDCGSYPFGGWEGGDFVYVDGGELSSTGKGSEDRPYQSINAAIDKALKRKRPIVVASGDYDERLVLDARHHGLQIYGVCSTTLSLHGSGVSAISLDGDPDTVVVIEDLTVDNEEGVGIDVASGQLLLDGVSVQGAIGSGVAATGRYARVEMSHGAVADVQRSELSYAAYGLAAAEGALLVATDIDIKHSGLAAVILDGGEAVLTGLTVVGGLPSPEAEDSPEPAGVIVTNRGDLTLTDADISDSWAAGLEVSALSTASLHDVAIHGVHSGGAAAEITGEGGFGNAVSVLSGSALDATELTLSGAALYGLSMGGEGTFVTVSGGAITDSEPDPSQPTAGIGVVVDAGATAILSDLALSRNHLFAVAVEGVGSSLTLTDSDVLDTQPTGNYPVGGGLLVQDQAEADVERVTVDGSGTVGVLVDNAAATLLDLAVLDTLRGPLQSTAVGVAIQNGSTVDAFDLVVRRTEGPGLMVGAASVSCARCTLTANGFAGIVVGGGALTVSDSEISGTVADANEGGGVGVYVSNDPAESALVLERSTIQDNAHAAVYAEGDGLIALEDDTLIGGAASRAVWPRGTAVFASGTTDRLSISGCTIADSDGAGLFFDGGTGTLSGNSYYGNTIDIVQQLCSQATVAPAGWEDEPVETVELCPPYDYPVELLSFSTFYEPIDLGEP